MAPNSRPGRRSRPVTACCHDYSHNTAHNRYDADAGVREPRPFKGRSSKHQNGTEPNERYRPARQFQAAIIPPAFGAVWTLAVRGSAAKPSLAGYPPDVLLLEADLQAQDWRKKRFTSR